MPKTFKARIKHEGSALGWKIVDVPFDVKKTFGAAGRVPVCGDVNGFPFRTSLFPRKSGQHFLMLNKQMQKGAGASAIGDAVTVTMDLDEEERFVEVPEQLAEALEAEDGLRAFYDAFNYSTRKWIADTISAPKSEAAKMRRAEQMAVRLIEVREGAEETPPILVALFQHNPIAQRAWKEMPVSHRYRHLLGIFNSSNPQTRQKRAEKAIEMMTGKLQ